TAASRNPGRARRGPRTGRARPQSRAGPEAEVPVALLRHGFRAQRPRGRQRARQANRELAQRFDFKDTGARFELQELTVTLHAQVDFQLKQMLEILKLRLSKRGVDLACLEVKEPQTSLSAAHQAVVLRHGIDQDTGRTIMRLVKDSKLKVQASL